MGASAIPKSVDFRAFEIKVKTITPIQNCINLDTQYDPGGQTNQLAASMFHLSTVAVKYGSQ